MMHFSKYRRLAILVIVLLWSAPVSAQEGFDVARYQELKRSDRPLVELMLGAMYETVFYAQESIGGAVVCASPIPIPGPRLVEMVDREIAAPTNSMQTDYGESDHIAFILMNALKSEDACK